MNRIDGPSRPVALVLALREVPSRRLDRRGRAGGFDDELRGPDQRRPDAAGERGRLPGGVGDDPLQAVDDVVDVDEVARPQRVARDDDRLARRARGRRTPRSRPWRPPTRPAPARTRRAAGRPPTATSAVGRPARRDASRTRTRRAAARARRGSSTGRRSRRRGARRLRAGSGSCRRSRAPRGRGRGPTHAGSGTPAKWSTASQPSIRSRAARSPASSATAPSGTPAALAAAWPDERHDVVPPLAQQLRGA